jgi:hypothetical protein
VDDVLDEDASALLGDEYGLVAVAKEGEGEPRAWGLCRLGDQMFPDQSEHMIAGNDNEVDSKSRV